MNKVFPILFTLLLTVPFPGCGGGTVGSSSTAGLGKTISGTVNDQDGSPIAGATVTAVSTGDSATTKSDGSFEFETKLTDEPQEIIIRSPDGRQVTLRSVYPGPDGDIEINVKFDIAAKAEFRGITIEVELGGACKERFYTFNNQSNEQVERDVNRLGAYLTGFDQLEEFSTPANCAFVGKILRDGRPFSGLKWKVSSGGCDNNSQDAESLEEQLETREVVSSGETDSNGKIDAGFVFNPRPGDCNWSLSFTEEVPVPIAILAYSRLEIDNY